MLSSVWKPLVGPVENWPLAVCDRSSINQAEDIVVHDAVFGESLVETGELQFSEKQRFFYLSDQQTHESLVILQTDSISGNGMFTHDRQPHALAYVLKAHRMHRSRYWKLRDSARPEKALRLELWSITNSVLRLATIPSQHTRCRCGQDLLLQSPNYVRRSIE